MHSSFFLQLPAQFGNEFSARHRDCMRSKAAHILTSTCTILLLMAPQMALGAIRYFDATAGAGNGVGGSGFCIAQTTALFSSSLAGDGTLVAAAATDDGVFQGSAGTVTLIGNYSLNSATFNTTNYVLTSGGTAAVAFSAPISLSDSVNLYLIEATRTADRAFGVGSVSGGQGSQLTIQGAQTGTSSARINLSANAVISVPTLISGVRATP